MSVRTRIISTAGSLVVLVAALLSVAAARPAQTVAPNVTEVTRVCAYSAHSIKQLSLFSRLVGRTIDCATVFDDAAPGWNAWERPWFVNYRHYPDHNWSRWATARRKHRLLVIGLGLIPASMRAVDWRGQGAAGLYVGHARRLARNLIRAGLGQSVIRLAPEPNLPSRVDWVGSTPREITNWLMLWRLTVQAMRSVRGAGFAFNWCINEAVLPLPLWQIYPGDRYVDSIGIDAYDSGVAPGVPRWPTVYGRVDGIRQVALFARVHRKPFAIPEWGIGPVGQYRSGGDDPSYIHGIASVVRTFHPLFQSYFFTRPWASQLEHSPRSLAAYRAHFGLHGDAVNTG